MAKPFGRYEIGFLDHPKFLALSGNAISLWWEGKNYCDKHFTDGLIPASALKYFRFRGEKTVRQLMTSCGVKADGETAYGPLWEPHPVGYKMHDYLDHNDCRDVIMARMDRADRRREEERDRKAGWRKSKDAKKAGDGLVSHGTETDLSHGTKTGQSHGTVRSTTQHNTTSTSTSANADVARARPQSATLVTKRRGDAAWEGPRGLYVLHTQHQQFVASRHGDEAAVLAFYSDVGELWGYGVMKDANINPDMPKFWNARFAEKWPPTEAPPASRSSEPEWVRKARERKAAEAQP
jgi:hypothetical protein